MFDIGFAELILIAVIGLLILGPERLPTVLRTIGRWTGRARATLSNLQHELERESRNKEMKQRYEKHLRELGLNPEDLSGDSAAPSQPVDDTDSATGPDKPGNSGPENHAEPKP